MAVLMLDIIKMNRFQAFTLVDTLTAGFKFLW